MEASALTTASHSGLLARRSPLLRLQSDEKLVALIRDGHDRAFEVLFDRYGARLLAFCRHLLGSIQDAEDVLQEVFVAAHAAMLADEREIKARPWLYRIARNRCLNFLRRPNAEGQDSMDVHPHANGTTTLEHVQRREEMRAIFADVHELPETQRTALVLREIDDLSYTEIAQAMGTTLPSVKSLLVRARMSLAEASEARVLTCDEVRLELAEAAEGIAKVSGPTRRHVRGCERCHRYRRELRSSSRALTALAPFGLLALVRKLIGAKVGGGATGSAAGGGVGAAGGAAAAAGGSGFGSAAIAAGSGGAGLAGAMGAKAAVGMATAALITAGAVGVKNFDASNSGDPRPAESTASIAPAGHWQPIHRSAPHNGTGGVTAPVAQRPEAKPAPGPEATAAPAPPPEDPATASQPATSSDPQPVAPPADQGSTSSSSGGTDTVAGSSSTDGTTGGDPIPPPDPITVPPLDPTTPTPTPTTPPDSTPPPDSDSSSSSGEPQTAPATVVPDGRTLY
jgi:RNA polymerase sigma factor (sigma-70 family)